MLCCLKTRSSVLARCCNRSLSLPYPFFFLSFVAPFVDFKLANVEKLGKRSLLISRPDRVLLKFGLKDTDFYLPKAITLLYGALLATEVNNDSLLRFGFAGPFLWLLR